MTLKQKILKEYKHWKDYEIQKPDGSWTTVANLLQESIEKAEQEIITLRSDLYGAIGHMQGCGHIWEYLEKKYPLSQQEKSGKDINVPSKDKFFCTKHQLNHGQKYKSCNGGQA